MKQLFAFFRGSRLTEYVDEMAYFRFFILTFMFLLKQTTVIECPSSSNFNFFLSPKQCLQSDYCYKSDLYRVQSKLYSTKTAYRTAYPANEFSAKEFRISDCEPSNIFLLIRHGTRFPPSRDIRRFSQMEQFRDKILMNLEKLSTKPLCADDLELLKQWKWNYSITAEQGFELVTEGFAELREIGERFKENFPNLFAEKYDPKRFHFRHTDTERTRSSFRSFVAGIFDESAHENISAEQPKKQADLLLKPYAYCSRWQEVKKSLKQPDSERSKFKNANIFNQMIRDIDCRFGFDGTLQFDDVNNIFNLCRYEQAWNITADSVWCSLLYPSHVRILEYYEDLSYYYKSSHGSEVNKNIQCKTIQDMLERFEDEKLPQVTAYFTHSAAVQLFLTALGALKDDRAPTATNYADMYSRKWKTSVVSPFAANVAIVKYKCPKESKVKFFLNERVLKLDWCSSDGICDWSNVQSKYSRFKNAQCETSYC